MAITAAALAAMPSILTVTLPLIFFKHGVDLTGGKKITPWGIDPDGDVTGICF